MNDAWVLVLHAASTWALVGLIWTIHVVHYPLFEDVGEKFPRYHERHMSRITLVVGPLMLVELVSGLWLCATPPAGTSETTWWIGAALLGVVWLETGLVASPQHGRIARDGLTAARLRGLMAGDLVRMLAWTARGVLVTFALMGALGADPRVGGGDGAESATTTRPGAARRAAAFTAIIASTRRGRAYSRARGEWPSSISSPPPRPTTLRLNHQPN